MDKLLAHFYISDYTIVTYLYIYFGRGAIPPFIYKEDRSKDRSLF